MEVRRDYLAWTPQKQDQLEDGHEIPAAERYGIGEHSEMMLEGQAPNGEISQSSRGGSDGDMGIQELKIAPAPRQAAESNPPHAHHPSNEQHAALRPVNEKTEDV